LMLDDIHDLIGCTIRTHYGTGGKVIYVGRPYKDKSLFNLNYTDPRDGRRCIINYLKLVGGQVLCECIPLKISGTSAPRQLSLFGYSDVMAGEE